MKKPVTKIVGVLMVATILATIGAVLVGAETDDASETEDWHMPFFGTEKMFGHRGMRPELSDEQQAEIDALITSLTEEGASCDEIREAIDEKLDEMGILDEQLDNAIEQTEQRLEILNRENELRDQGYSWEEINEIIQEEFDLEYPAGICQGFGQDPQWTFHEHSEEDLAIETTAI